MNESFSMEDSYTNRVVTLPQGTQAPNRTIIVRLAYTTPLFIASEPVITSSTIKEQAVTVAESDDNKLVDAEWSKNNQNTARMTLMGVAQSVVTGNSIYIYYDHKWKDMIILPNVAPFVLAGDNITFPIDGVRIGGGVNFPTQNIFHNISMDAADRFKLPEGKANVKTIKTRFVSIPRSSTNGSNTAKLTTYIADKFSYEETVSSMITVVELGTKADLFNNPDTLPTYLFYQNNLLDSGLRYLGPKDTGNNKLYIRLSF